MKKIALATLLVVAAAAAGQAAIVVTAPAAQVNVKSCNEYSTDVLRDKWDMNQRSDLGWRIYNSVEQPRSYLTNIAFSGGIFSATTVFTAGGPPELPSYSDCNISILDSHYLGSATIGKDGARYPINADKYTVLAMRASFDPSAAGNLAIIYWSTNTIYNGSSWTNIVPYIFKGWAVYYFDIPALGMNPASTAGPWAGTVDSLRIDPFYEKDRQIQIDWIRLVEKDATLDKTISWTNDSLQIVDIYLDNDSDPGNGTLGIVGRTTAPSQTSFTFLAGGLAAGDYYAVVVPTGTSPAAASAHSAGFFRVNDAPILSFTKPTAEGSTEDFATVTFNDPWDMANNQDIEYTAGQTGGTFTTASYYDLAGTLFSNRTVYQATSTAAAPGNVGDPIVNFLYWDTYSRGRNRKILADRYHNLVATFGIAGAWSVNDGSIARVIWKKNGESVENVSDDIVMRHLNDNSADWGQTVLNKIVLDMKTLPLEPGGSPSTTGWNGLVEGFRIDPHEFSSPRAFYYDDVKLTADWRADASFPITWQVAQTDGDPVPVSIYYDPGWTYAGTLIASGVTGGSTTWDCSAVPEGTYYIYATWSDGTNTGRRYATGPVIVEHHTTPEIRLSRTFINFGSVNAGPVTSAYTVGLSNAGSGTLNWTVSLRTDNPFLKVSPMSGTGNATLTIWIDQATLPPSGPFWGTVTVTDPAAMNSPQIVEVWGTVYAAGATAAPFGDFSTPVNGTTGVTGAVPVTGWVLDDIETTGVKIYRDTVAGDPPGAIGPNGKVFIGDAVFVEGARPDVEVLYPTYPLNTRAGWGYMLLTNFLPSQGNGTFVLHAYATDLDGHTVSLGSKSITCDNAHAAKPFGTIDTPVQGATVSGTLFANFGWVLTPLTATIPTNGSTISVFVDSVQVGTLNTPPNLYNEYRADIASLFPGLNNSNGAVGLFYLDLTQYLNGVHTIAWLAYDDQARGDGIGSRYFTVANAGGAPIAPDPAVNAPEDPSGRLRIVLDMEGERRTGTAQARNQTSVISPAQIKRRAAGAGGTGEGGETADAEIEVQELGRVEIAFASAGTRGKPVRFVGWGRDAARPLPVGSTLDPETGRFSWMPGPGFLGRHEIHFAVTDGEMKSRPFTVAVTIVPKKSF